MITQETKRKPQPKKKYIFITIGLLFIDLILFILIKCDVFNSIDNNLRASIQSSLITQNDNQNQSKIPLFVSIIHYLNHFLVYYGIILLLNNFSNIYKSFMLFHIISISVYLSSLIKFIFYKVSFNLIPDNNNNNGNIFYCEYGFTLPSTEIIVSVSFYLSLWKLFFDSVENLIQIILKWFCLFLVVVLNIINIIGILINGYYFLSQIIFSIILGIIIYLFVFETNLIWLNDGQVLINFIREKFNLYFIIYTVLSIISISIFFIERNVNQENDSNTNINKNFNQCVSVNNGKILEKSGNYKSFVDGTFCLISMFLGQLFVIVGYKFEVGYVFEDDLNTYYQFYFPISLDDIKFDNENKDNSGSIVLARDTQWNNTSWLISLGRLVATFALGAICFIPYFVVDINGNNFRVIFFVKFLLSFVLFSLGTSYFFKVVLRFMKLTNATLYSIMSDK